MREAQPLVIVYATQTGQSKTIAELIHDMALKRDYKVSMHNIDEYEKTFTFASIRAPLVFVCSTTGDGETPESARKAYSRLKRSSSSSVDLSHLRYALLGLGDSNYNQFCNGPKLFHKRLQELGATCFYGPFWADDGVGLELEVEPFKEGLWKAIEDVLNQNHKHENGNSESVESKLNKLVLTDSEIGSELTLPDLTECHMSVDFVRRNDQEKQPLDMKSLFTSIHAKSSIHRATVVSTSLLTSLESLKKCYSVKFKSEIEFEYEPGHAIDIAICNSDNEVNSLLNRLDLGSSRNNVVSIKMLDSTKKQGSDLVKMGESNSDLTLFELFKYCLDIRSNALKKTLLRVLASYCAAENDRLRLLQLASREGSEQYLSLVKEAQLSVLDLLETFESCRPPLSHLVQMLPMLNTRAYSLCTRTNESCMEIVFSLVEFDKANGRMYARNGVGTGYLSRLNPNEDIYFQKRKFNTLTFPEIRKQPSPPLILIGPGTGIAPFISLLRELNTSDNKSTPSAPFRLWLFYGCRHPDWDFLFKDELTTHLKDCLEKLSICFSRLDSSSSTSVEIDHLASFYTPGCRYVQDAIRHYRKEVVELIDTHKASVFVCGDAKNMAKDVNSCLNECLRNELGLNQEDANKYLTELIKTKRYKQDIWA